MEPAMDEQANTPEHPFRDAARGVRLQKVLAAAGVGSRRACEAIIEAGVVTVNGHPVTSLPAWVDPALDRISVEGRAIRAPQAPVHVLLHKPRGVVCTNDEGEDRPRAIDLVKHPSGARLFPVGRLDADSSGLLLMTNDGVFANRIMHPRHGVSKVYEVIVKGSLDPRAVERLERGLFLADRGGTNAPRPSSPPRRARVSSLKLLRRDRDRTRLRMELHEGRNRQVRRMLARLGHPVKRLRRIRLGPLRLKGLAAGAWRDLTAAEVRKLVRD